METKIKCIISFTSRDGKYYFIEGKNYTYSYVKESEGFHMELTDERNNIMINPFDMNYVSEKNFDGVNDFHNKIINL